MSISTLAIFIIARYSAAAMAMRRGKRIQMLPTGLVRNYVAAITAAAESMKGIVSASTSRRRMPMMRRA